MKMEGQSLSLLGILIYIYYICLGQEHEHSNLFCSVHLFPLTSLIICDIQHSIVLKLF